MPGFINTVSYTIANNVPWDIARDAEGELLTDGTQILPMVINVSMTFTPIHNFIPKKGENFISTNTSI